VSVEENIEHIKALPPSERAQVAKFVVENDDSWIPDSFKQGMADADAGQFADIAKAEARLPAAQYRLTVEARFAVQVRSRNCGIIRLPCRSLAAGG
jgi:hypothetical protein